MAWGCDGIDVRDGWETCAESCVCCTCLLSCCCTALRMCRNSPLTVRLPDSVIHLRVDLPPSSLPSTISTLETPLQSVTHLYYPHTPIQLTHCCTLHLLSCATTLLRHSPLVLPLTPHPSSPPWSSNSRPPSASQSSSPCRVPQMQSFTGKSSNAAISQHKPPRRRQRDLTRSRASEENCTDPPPLSPRSRQYSMKLHKLAQPSPSDFSSQSVHLAEKYLGRYSGSDSQVPFSDAARRRGGAYPPSRDGQFRTMKEQDEFNAMVAKGGHDVPLTSEFPTRSLALWEGGEGAEAPLGRPPPSPASFRSTRTDHVTRSQTTSTLSTSPRSPSVPLLSRSRSSSIRESFCPLRPCKRTYSTSL